MLLLLSGWFNAFAADVPPVLFVGEDFTGEMCRIVEKKIADELNVLGRTAGMDVKCVHINGIGDARRIISSGNTENSVHLLCNVMISVIMCVR